MASKALKMLFDTLAELINMNEEELDFKAIKKQLETQYYYLKKENLKLTVDLAIESKKCSMCLEPIKKSKISSTIKLNCKHIVCSNACLQKRVIDFNKFLSEYESTKCIYLGCEQYIHNEIIEAAFGGRKNLEKLIIEDEESKAPKFDCLICGEKIRVDQGVTLECDDRFCRNCLLGYTKTCVNDAKVSDKDLICPNCGTPGAITINMLKYILDPKDFAKVEKFLLRDFKPDIEVNEIFFKCNGNNCEYFEILAGNIEKFECPSCKLLSCPKCRGVPHPNYTCEQWDKKKKDDADDQEFIKFAKEQGLKTCPHCKSICERISGCNYMRCYSNDCKGKKAFCLLCEVALVEAQHYSHYKAQGPFGKVCNTLDGSKE
jgi:hypothetical protein